MNSTIKERLKELSKEQGLETAIKFVGDTQTYVKVAYNGNLIDFFKEEKVEPYEIKGDGPSMYIHPLIVESLKLRYYRPDEIELGKFRYGLYYNYSIDTRLIKTTYLNKNVKYKVVGISGDYGFGLSYFNKGNTLGKRDRIRIYEQIIDKYDLNKYKP